MKSIDPAIKFVSLLIVTLILAWKYNLILNTAVFILCILALMQSRVSLKKIAILFLPVLLAALGMFFTGYKFSTAKAMPVNAKIFHLGNSALLNGLTQASRVLSYAGVGGLFALTTDRVDMVRSFKRQFHFPQVFAYGLLAAWGIFPQMIREYKRTKAAFRARGVSAFPLSPAFLKPMLVKAVRWSDALSVAMESKGFDANAKRTEYNPMQVRKKDWLFLASTIIILLTAAIFLE